MTEKPTSMLDQSRRYLAEVQGEFNKITWPPQTEMINGTISVLVIVLLVATFLGLVDFVLSRLMQRVLG